jgi:1-deoxy-D-xylulose-5-phosphate synthase
MQNKHSVKNIILDRITSPDDLKKLSEDEMVQLADELRSFILDIVSVHPGHLGASLGVVELTIALHYVYNTPYDILVWDVGHQAYSHKILTGRKDSFHTLRQWQGVGGFPSPDESIYDSFVAGHASTAISAILGMEKASKLKGELNRKHVAVIGDGGLSGGMAFEALNNALNSDILIVFNDNGIAIDKNIGTIGSYLKKNNNKENKITGIFDVFGFNYYGVYDGHNVKALIDVFEKIKDVKGPKLVHVKTVKGKGFKKAEQDQTRFHAPGRFDRNTGEIYKEETSLPTFPDIYGMTLKNIAEENKSVVAITPAMITGSSLWQFQSEYPDRIFDVGIAEQHAVTFSAGLAAGGLKPFCTIYSTFLQRAVDQIIHDVALPKLPVVFAIDRAGLVGEDGATHQGVFDLAFMRLIPNMIVSAPMDADDLQNLVYTASKYDEGPFSIRYSKNYINKLPHKQFNELTIGKGRIINDGDNVALVTLGYSGILAMKAREMLLKENIYPAHFDMRFLKPFDEKLLIEVFKNFKTIITIEDGIKNGGLADTVLEIKQKINADNNFIALGVPNKFIPHGKRSILYNYCGYGTESIYAEVKKLLRK